MITSTFHYAFKVKDIESTRAFYADILGCAEGRSTESWIDFDFFGNQLSAHVSVELSEPDYCGLVDGVQVPIPHFGCILKQDDFKRIQEKLLTAEVTFILKPQQRYAGQVGEQVNMFVLDYSGNAPEFKSFRNTNELFSEQGDV